jgi:hypothetical protein
MHTNLTHFIVVVVFGDRSIKPLDKADLHGSIHRFNATRQKALVVVCTCACCVCVCVCLGVVVLELTNSADCTAIYLGGESNTTLLGCTVTENSTPNDAGRVFHRASDSIANRVSAYFLTHVYLLPYRRCNVVQRYCSRHVHSLDIHLQSGQSNVCDDVYQRLSQRASDVDGACDDIAEVVF